MITRIHPDQDVEITADIFYVADRLMPPGVAVTGLVVPLFLRQQRQMAGIEVARERGVYKGRKQGATKGKPSRVVTLRAKGLSNAEIAQSLGISRRTVQRYLKAT